MSRWNVEPLADRFMTKAGRADVGCWLWEGTIRYDGYGHISSGRRSERQRMLYAHRVAYELFRGPIPAGLEVDHVCGVRHCVNPDHLEPVTHSENLRRAVTVGGDRHSREFLSQLKG